jgi:hypothetical protein
MLAGCASERLEPSAPQGVNLSGEWNFDPNLSDDPSKLGGDSDKTPQRTPGSHRGHGGGRGGGGGGAMPPMGGPGGGYNYLPVALSFQDNATTPAQPAPDAAPTQDTPPAPVAPNQGPAGPGSTANGPPRGRGPAARSLRAAMHMSITQKDGSVFIRANMTDGTQLAEEYKAGTDTTIAYGPDATAKRSVGWRGPVFVITTDAKKGGWHEEDFALDDAGHLIMTTTTKGGRQGTGEIKRVYDRSRGTSS